MRLCNFAPIKFSFYGNEQIKEILQARKMSQRELTTRIGKSLNMVNLYVSNRVQPPIPILYRIAEILDIDVRELLVSNK